VPKNIFSPKVFNMDQQHNQTPSEKSKENLNRLSQEFKPDDVKFLLALKSNFSLEEAIDNAEGAIQRLKSYVDNDHSFEGLDFQYGSVEKC
jgi:hypothetical protein